MHNYFHLLHNPVFWVTVAFFIVIGAIVKLVVPSITKQLDKRAANITEELERATALREEGQVILAQYQKKQRESMKEAEEIVQKANLEARRITREAELEVESQLKKRMKMATDKIEQAERQALQEVQQRIIDITVTATRQIVQNKLTASAHNELIRRAAEDVQEKLH